MPPVKHAAAKRKLQRSRSAQLRLARSARMNTTPDSNLSTAPQPALLSTPTPQDQPSPPTAESTSKRKLNYFSQLPSQSTTSLSYILVDTSNLGCLFSNLPCPSCRNCTLVIDVRHDPYMGMACELLVRCTSCDELLSSTPSSRRIGQAFDVNKRISMAFTNIGLGQAGLSSFCEVFGMHPLGKTAHHDHKAKIFEASTRAKETMKAEAHTIVKKAYTDANLATPDEDGIIDISVSYDGSWHKRGHCSKHGVGCVIDSLTGLVLDYEAMSLHCQMCASKGEALKSDAALYSAWLEGHKPKCEINHSGSSGAMEVAAAKTMWPRSLQYGLRYTTMIGDGDCKTILELKSLQPYGSSHPVLKEECINHFAKRLGTALKKVVSTEKARGVTLGGVRQGSLTQNKIVIMQSYFTRAILQNPGSVQNMRNAMWAIYYHAASSDAHPQHNYCPSGPDSWCKYQKAVAQNLPPPPHKSSIVLSDKVASFIKATFERLTSDELLGRCLQGKTQNPNESVHSVIWNFCPKHRFVGGKRIAVALYLGTAQYNSGSRSLRALMKEASLSFNETTVKLGALRDMDRITQAEKSALQSAKRRREIRRQANLRAQREVEAMEGPMYAAGEF